MKRIIFLILILFLFINLIGAKEVDQTDRNLVISGFSVFYSGITLLSAGVPFLIAGNNKMNKVLTGFGYAFSITGLLSVELVGPILSIIGNYGFIKKSVVEDRIDQYSGFWYGMGWSGAILGGLILLPLFLTGGMLMESPAGYVLISFAAILFSCAAGCFGASVTIPFVRIFI